MRRRPDARTNAPASNRASPLATNPEVVEPVSARARAPEAGAAAGSVGTAGADGAAGIVGAAAPEGLALIVTGSEIVWGLPAASRPTSADTLAR